MDPFIFKIWDNYEKRPVKKWWNLSQNSGQDR